jgi:hypothetical protein
MSAASATPAAAHDPIVLIRSLAMGLLPACRSLSLDAKLIRRLDYRRSRQSCEAVDAGIV